MTSQEQLAFLLELGGLDYKVAAGIAGVSPLTIKAYRKPSSTRNVPDAILRPLERHVFQQLAEIMAAAGYDVRPAS
jgi:hypothetical protein